MMDPSERAYRKNEWKEREERKRLNLEDNDPSPPPSTPKVFKKRTMTVDDYDEADVPNDYSMPIAVLVPGRLMVGPPCVTKRQIAFVKQRMGDPTMVPLELPPIAERRLWKPKDAATWYANYAKTVAADVDGDGGSAIYLCHETGCKEEALVGLLVWQKMLVPYSIVDEASFREWRERTGYLWFLDREEETLLPIALSSSSDASKNAGGGGMLQWLKRSK